MRANKTFNISDLYKPYPPQKRFHEAPEKYRLFGGAAGPGKTHAIRWEAILRSIKYDFPLTGAIFRKSYPELESTIIRGMQEMLPNWMYKYNQSQHLMTLFNGSIIEFCYAENDNDVYRYQGREWDWLGVDELTHFSEFQFLYLMSRVRTTKPINTKFFAATNPGNLGHAWVKKRWITKDCDDAHYNPDEYAFIPGKITDNVVLMKSNPDYIKNLQMLPEKERKALLDGDWDVFEGQFFSEWSPSRHIVDDFEVPEEWQLIMGWDDGTREPRSVHIYAIDNDQKIWCIWEYYKAGENLQQAAENIRRQLKEKGYWGRIYKCVVDPSMKRVDSQTGISSTEVLESMGFGFQIGEIELGNNNRKEGWRVMKTYLSHKPYEEPVLKFFKNCGNMIRTIPQLIYYQSRSGVSSKKEDLDTTQEDHCLAGDTVVCTQDGKECLKSLVGTSGLIHTLGGFQKYSNVRKTGHRKVYKVTFDDNTIIKCTAEHPILLPDFSWKSIGELNIGDSVLDTRSSGLIQSDTNESDSYKQDNSRIQWSKILQVYKIFSERWCKVASSCLGRPLWEDTQWLSYTSSGWQFSKQQDRKSGNVERVPTSFLSRKEYERRNQAEDRETQNRYSGGIQGVAPFTRGKSMAQSTCKGDVETNETHQKGLRVLWKRILDEISWSIKVLSSKLQSQSKTKKVKSIEYIGYRDVYNLQVDNVYCFSVEGGVIVHNCADDCRYALMSLDRLPSRFESNTFIKIKKREYTPRSSFN